MRAHHRTLTTSLTLLFILLALPVLAQVATSSSSTTAVTLDELLKESQGVYDAFKVLGWMAGLTAVVNLLINLTKFGPVNDFIVRKNAKWIRPMLALISGLIGGIAMALAKGLPGPTVALYAVGGMLSGGGAVALHELLGMFKKSPS